VQVTTPLFRLPHVRRSGRAGGLLLTATAALAGALLAGCGQPTEAAPPGAPVFEVGGTDTMRFDPETITVKAGQAVTIAFKNKGVIVHDYVTSGAEKNARLANVLGGREARGVFQANKPGIYQVLCVQPGHREAGMVGKIVVE
jgi:plastocyanin